ncbi:hypothetical protein GMORB2_0044 [Geosmithia morbida]|uniref:Uncharacterized protein n=1 Tax=Geosmithia morbida TaxID=1094350 RepID=A0A9P4Z082_9HYPO|nr:uncharacterized protein GMORB2_0044 [Geosmithia morbida]KAF4126308.1 hypothetical protein GMORB2_0044 [Geosmithia morbida]
MSREELPIAALPGPPMSKDHTAATRRSDVPQRRRRRAKMDSNGYGSAVGVNAGPWSGGGASARPDE